ncbi:MAG: pepsin/retropepsin-like aspartic protease family protein [Chloroflexota bacterium]
MVEIILRHADRHVRVVALVDSGADVSFFHMSYALDLGLNIADAQRTRAVGAGGAAVDCLSWPGLELEFEQDRFPFAGRFVDLPASTPRMNLLGRRDFFQRCTIQFWDAAGLFGIDLSPDFPRTGQPLR